MRIAGVAYEICVKAGHAKPDFMRI